jgi:hypothetical protein
MFWGEALKKSCEEKDVKFTVKEGGNRRSKRGRQMETLIIQFYFV